MLNNASSKKVDKVFPPVKRQVGKAVLFPNILEFSPTKKESKAHLRLLIRKYTPGHPLKARYECLIKIKRWAEKYSLEFPKDLQEELAFVCESLLKLYVLDRFGVDLSILKVEVSYQKNTEEETLGADNCNAAMQLELFV